MHTLSAATDAERVALADLLSHAFAFPAAEAPVWFERAGHDHVLAWREGGGLVGGLITIPMGQYFGGASVPMEGVAGVGVAPEHRANGAATRMMQALVRDMRARGVALSTLYPATVPLYQRAGYERAGGRWRTAVRPQELPTRHDPALRVVTLASVGEGETLALYEAHCRLRNGPLDRGPYLWSRIQSPVRMTVRRMGIRGPDGLEGYVVVSHVAKDGHDTEVAVVDAVAGTARAADAILVTLGAYRSLAQEVRWHGGPHDTLTQRLRDRRHAVTLTDFWMLRLVDVPRALALRGYNPFVKAAVTFVVRDEVVPENQGAWRVAVEDGRVEVTKSEGGGVALDVRALATLYAGFRTAEALAADGLAAGDDRDLAAATALFAGATPALAEHF